MLRIRLTRGGKKRQPQYRVVVAEVSAKRDGRFVEQIGFYNPLTNPETYRIEEERALYWLANGAQPSDAVKRLLEKQGTYGRLARLHGGETLDALVSEYEGKPLAEAAPEKGRLATAAAAVVEAVKDVAEDVAEAVEDVVENVVEAVEDLVDGDAEADAADADAAEADAADADAAEAVAEDEETPEA